MAASVQRYFQEGLAPSTRRTYGAAMNRFNNFCTHFSIHTPFPVTEPRLCSFAAYLADQGLAPQTIRSYLSAVRNTQISLGFPDPRDHSSLPILKRVQAGIQRVRSLGGPSARLRLPITAKVMGRIRAHLEVADIAHKELMWAICCTAFFGFFRLGELLPEAKAKVDPAVSLMWGDVAVDGRDKPTMVRVHLKRSKCDQFGAGANIVLGATGQPLCPVTAILRYIQARGPSPGVFFRKSPSEPVLKPWFVDQLRDVLAAVGLPRHQYAGHSFRIGAATTAAMAGVEDSTIQTLGRWHSSAYLQYIRLPSERLAGVSVVLAKHSNSR